VRNESLAWLEANHPNIALSIAAGALNDFDLNVRTNAILTIRRLDNDTANLLSA
jgi:hypothetical protein